jgi:hypothetical protein
MATRMSMDEYNRRLMAIPDDSTKHDALYRAHQRVGQLEALNAALAAQVDRMRPVVDIAIEWADAEDGSDDEKSAGAALVWEVGHYKEQMAQLAKECE